MKKQKKIIGFTAALLFSFGFIAVIRLSQGLSLFDSTTLVFGITNLFSVLSINYLFVRVLAINSTKSVMQLKKRIIPSFVFSLFATTFIALSLYFLGSYALFRIKGWDMENFINRIGLSGAIVSLSIGLFICCIIFFYVTWRQAIDREQQLREENLKYQYRTLKTQVNPHFLFNSLNTLSEIVYVDAKKADSYIQKLSGIYRYILDNEETDLISLDKEIEFVRQYFSLQKERDEEKIRLEIDIENAEKFKTVPISIQILVENAFKHNIMSEEKPLKINIYRDNEYVAVSNNIQLKNILSNNYSGTGLSNLKERVKLIMRKELIINQENNLFLIKLPIISI